MDLAERIEFWRKESSDLTPSQIHAILQGEIATEEEITEEDLERAMVATFGANWREQF